MEAFIEANVHTKLQNYNLRKKYNINFNLGVTNQYNLKILIINSTIKLEFFENLRTAVEEPSSPLSIT